MELKIIKNPDRKRYEQVTEMVAANDGYCPCLVFRNEDTKCPCKYFRETDSSNLCHCGRFAKIESK